MSNYKLEITHRRTRKKRVLTLEEFKKEFAEELKNIIDYYSQEMEKNNYLPDIMGKKDHEGDFYLSLHFNFNNYGRFFCDWYIERIL